MHDVDEVTALARLLQGGRGLVRDHPASRLGLDGKPIALKPLRPVEKKIAVPLVQVGAACYRPEIDEALDSLLGEQRSVEPRHPPLGIDLMQVNTARAACRNTKAALEGRPMWLILLSN